MSAEGNKKRKGKVGGMAIVAEVVGAGSGKEVSWAARVNGLSFLRLSIINKTDGPLNFTHAKKNRSVPPSPSPPPSTASRPRPRRRPCTAAARGSRAIR